MIVYFPTLSSNPKCAAELESWNLKFDKELISYPARVLPTEQIFQTEARVSPLHSELVSSPDHAPCKNCTLSPLPMFDNLEFT